MNKVKFENRIVAFIDILGFKDIIKNDFKLQSIYNAIEFLKRAERPENWSSEFVEVEESAQYKGTANFDISKDVLALSFSDSVVVSISADSEDNLNHRLSTFISNIAYIGANLLLRGILLRGAITIGKLLHKPEGIIMGEALVEAYELEKTSAIYPRIILSKKLIEKMRYPVTTKSQSYPYHQYIKRFDDGCVGFHQLIFFQVLENAPTIISPEKLPEYLSEIRKQIICGLDEHFESPSIFSKYDWLKKEYNKLYILGENQDKSPIKKKIMDMNENIREGNIHYSYTDDYYYKKRESMP